MEFGRFLNYYSYLLIVFYRTYLCMHFYISNWSSTLLQTVFMGMPFFLSLT